MVRLKGSCYRHIYLQLHLLDVFLYPMSPLLAIHNVSRAEVLRQLVLWSVAIYRACLILLFQIRLLSKGGLVLYLKDLVVSLGLKSLEIYWR